MCPYICMFTYVYTQQQFSFQLWIQSNHFHIERLAFGPNWCMKPQSSQWWKWNKWTWVLDSYCKFVAGNGIWNYLKAVDNSFVSVFSENLSRFAKQAQQEPLILLLPGHGKQPRVQARHWLTVTAFRAFLSFPHLWFLNPRSLCGHLMLTHWNSADILHFSSASH